MNDGDSTPIDQSLSPDYPLWCGRVADGRGLMEWFDGWYLQVLSIAVTDINTEVKWELQMSSSRMDLTIEICLNVEGKHLSARYIVSSAALA